MNLEDLYYSYYRYYFFHEKEYYREYLKCESIINEALKNENYPERDDILGFYYYILYHNHMSPKMIHLCITDFCQLRCKHCYFGQDERLTSMSTENLKIVLDKFLKYRQFFIDKGFEHLRTPSLNLAGGEPMCHPDILGIIDTIPKNVFSYIKFVTNGYTYDKRVIEHLQERTDYTVYQISLDGTEKVHDYIRGDGSYKRVINTIDSIKKDFPELHIQMQFNGHHDNYRDIINVSRIVKEHGVRNIFFDRYVPYWDSGLKRLTTEEFKEFNELIIQAGKELNNDKFNVTIARSLQDCKYVCNAAIEHNVIKADGSRNICTRYLMNHGNFITDSVEQIIETSIKNNIKVKKIPRLCRTCKRLPICKGGMRCLTYVVKNSFCEPDVNCYRYISE